MTALDLIVNFGRIESAISGSYRYMYITVAALDSTELKTLVGAFGGAYSRYEAQGEEYYKWRSSSIESLARVIVALRDLPEFAGGQPYAMLSCLTVYVTCGRSRRKEVADGIRDMMGRSSLSIMDDVLHSQTPPQAASAPAEHPSS